MRHQGHAPETRFAIDRYSEKLFAATAVSANLKGIRKH
jgi:hypothetical protein